MEIEIYQHVKLRQIVAVPSQVAVYHKLDSYLVLCLLFHASILPFLFLKVCIFVTGHDRSKNIVYIYHHGLVS